MAGMDELNRNSTNMETVNSIIHTVSSVPSIKIEPCESLAEDDQLDHSPVDDNCLSPSANVNTLYPKPRTHPGNYKKNMTARFLLQGKSEDDSWYRSSLDCPPMEKRSKSLDRGLDMRPENEPLDLSQPRDSTGSRSKFEERARKMHQRHRTEPASLLHTGLGNNAVPLSRMGNLSHSDIQLNTKDVRHEPPRFFFDESEFSNGGSFEEYSLTPEHLAISPNSGYPPQANCANNKISDFMNNPPSQNFVDPASWMGPLNIYSSVDIQQSTNTMSSSVTPNQCPICKQMFHGFDSMAKHVAKHLPTEVKVENTNRFHTCKVCNRSFSRSDMLTRHMRLHTGLKPYECKICGQVFSRSDHLNTHKRTHTGEKPYSCPKCPYTACRRDMITRHMKIHNNDHSRKRQALGLMHLKHSASGSSIDSSDSQPSRGSISGNSFDGSFDSGDARWHQRNHLTPADIMRNVGLRHSWSAPNSIDLEDATQGSKSLATVTRMDSTDSDIIQTQRRSFARAQTLEIPGLTSGHNANRLVQSRKPSLVRQDASVDHDGLSMLVHHQPEKTLYRNPSEHSHSFDDGSSVTSLDKDSLLDSPRPSTLDIPSSIPSCDRKLPASLPKQNSISDELNMQSFAISE